MAGVCDRRTAARRGLSGLVACLFLALPAQADLYRCVGADGDVVFTDRPSKCPGVAPHDSTGDLQTLGTPPPPRRRQREARVSQPTALQQQQERATWQQKKRKAEQELSRVEEERETLRRYVTGCNRGMRIIGRDHTNMKYEIPCQRIRQEFAESETKLVSLRDYLEDGLRVECRRAGCLPGWIR